MKTINVTDECERQKVIKASNSIIDTRKSIATVNIDGNYGEDSEVEYNADETYPEGYWVKVWMFVPKASV